ncbi:hypothetical protein L6R52_39345 [Myxococcota bacterium]|nr:hypothetical protein [Myxococcota bacterium]
MTTSELEAANEGTKLRGRVRGYLRDRKYPPRRAIPTRAGLFALAAPIVLGVAAVNAGNNLLFMLLGGVLGAIVLSGILSERNLEGVEVDVRPVSSAHAGEPTRLLVTFSRPKWVEGGTPAYGLRMLERERRTLWMYLRDKEHPDLLDVTLPLLEGRSAQRLGTRRFERRGRAKLGYTELMTRYPFGLLTKLRDADVDVDVVVRPRRIDAPAELIDPRGLASDGDDSLRRGQGLELYGLREREERDALHRIHALRSLSLGRDVVVETAGIDRPIAWLGIANVEGASPEAFERTLEIAQALLTAWDERGFAVGLVAMGRSFEPGESSLGALLDALALLEPGALDVHLPSPGRALWLVPVGAEAPAGARAIARITDSGAIDVHAGTGRWEAA